MISESSRTTVKTGRRATRAINMTFLRRAGMERRNSTAVPQLAVKSGSNFFTSPEAEIPVCNDDFRQYPFSTDLTLRMSSDHTMRIDGARCGDLEGSTFRKAG